VAVGALRDIMNGSFFSRAQVENALQTACISVVPSVRNGKRHNLRGIRRAACDQGLMNGSSSRTIARDDDLIWTAVNSPFSRFAEALHSIKVAVDQNSGAANSGRACAASFARWAKRRTSPAV
jgi:polysaccharide biosynthesis transport protein